VLKFSSLTLKCLRWVPGDPHAGFLMFLSVYSIRWFWNFKNSSVRHLLTWIRKNIAEKYIKFWYTGYLLLYGGGSTGKPVEGLHCHTSENQQQEEAWEENWSINSDETQLSSVKYWLEITVDNFLPTLVCKDLV